MKQAFKYLTFAAGILLFINCSTSKEQKPDNGKEVTEKVESGTSETGFISGTVTEIQTGKDGYTAKIKTADSLEYFATISRANLTDPTTFRSVNIGEELTVQGDLWQMENQNHITVRKLK